MEHSTGKAGSTVSFRAAVTLLVAWACSPAPAADWPTWRADAARTAAAAEELPAQLHLAWVRKYPALEQAWPDPGNAVRMDFDKAYAPVVAGKTVLIASNRTDSVTALDSETGQEKWVFFAEAPVRFAPAMAEGRAYFVSDDGCLYCLELATGKCVWKFRAGPGAGEAKGTPARALAIGHGRLVSLWPARGAPVIVDGTVYFAAGIFPFMGTWLYALEAETGKCVWKNEQLANLPGLDPKTGGGYVAGRGGAGKTGQGGGGLLDGVAPQGYLVAIGDRLIVPCGRSMPAVFDRKTGRLLYYHLLNDAHAAGTGGSTVAAVGNYFFNSGWAFDLASGLKLTPLPTPGVVTAETLYLSPAKGRDKFTATSPTHTALDAYDLKTAKVGTGAAAGEKSLRSSFKGTLKLDIKQLWTMPLRPDSEIIKAGNRLYLAEDRKLMALDASAAGTAPKPAWTLELQGRAANLAAADGRLFASDLDGRIYCLAGSKAQPTTHGPTTRPSPVSPEWDAQAERIVQAGGVSEGYCLVLGAGTGQLAEALARQTKLQIIVADADPARIDLLRRRWHEQGLYGPRIAAVVGEPLEIPFPPYIAGLIVSEDPAAAGIKPDKGVLARLFRPLRPYGGTLCLPVPADQQAAWESAAQDPATPNLKAERHGDSMCLRREGPLPGSAQWTHMYCTPANTLTSEETRVRLPLGVLWFGGTSDAKLHTYRGWAPTPLVAEGRLFVQGPNIVRAQDVYTGRVLWERDLPGVGAAYDLEKFLPTARAVGSNYAATADSVYVVHKGRCLRLDAQTGKTLAEFAPPAPADDRSGQPPHWGFIAVDGDLLIGGGGPWTVKKVKAVRGQTVPGSNVFSHSHDRLLAVLDRRTGEVKWQRQAALGFSRNAVIVGGGTLFCIDRLRAGMADLLKQDGQAAPEGTPALLALDLATGKELWRKDRDVFGGWLAYSAPRDILIEAGMKAGEGGDRKQGQSKDNAVRGGDRLLALRGKDGTVLWDKSFPSTGAQGPYIFYKDALITQYKFAFGLTTGERVDPRTGKPGLLWTYGRGYGCSDAFACQTMMTFRGGAASLYDFATARTYRLGGFRSPCTNTMVPADGVLAIPDYTRGCTCAYQNQTSLAVVHMPELEKWFRLAPEPSGRGG